MKYCAYENCLIEVPSNRKYCEEHHEQVRREKKCTWQKNYQQKNRDKYKKYQRKWKKSTKGYTIGLGAKLVMARLGVTPAEIRATVKKITEPKMVNDFMEI